MCVWLWRMTIKSLLQPRKSVRTKFLSSPIFCKEGDTLYILLASDNPIMDHNRNTNSSSHDLPKHNSSP